MNKPASPLKEYVSTAYAPFLGAKNGNAAGRKYRYCSERCKRRVQTAAKIKALRNVCIAVNDPAGSHQGERSCRCLVFRRVTRSRHILKLDAFHIFPHQADYRRFIQTEFTLRWLQKGVRSFQAISIIRDRSAPTYSIT